MDDLTRERFLPAVPVCPVCGHTAPGNTRYKRIRPHSQRRINKNGHVYDSRVPCEGRGEFPEYVTPEVRSG